jgi:hypothetical protein
VADLPAQTVTAEAWNAAYKPGQPVIVRRDDGSLWNTKTRSEAWNLGHGQPVVMLEGKSGGYDLSRVRPIFNDEITEDFL